MAVPTLYKTGPDGHTRCRLWSTCKRQKHVENLGVRVGDLRSSDVRKDKGKARHDEENGKFLTMSRRKERLETDLTECDSAVLQYISLSMACSSE